MIKPNFVSRDFSIPGVTATKDRKKIMPQLLNMVIVKHGFVWLRIVKHFHCAQNLFNNSNNSAFNWFPKLSELGVLFAEALIVFTWIFGVETRQTRTLCGCMAVGQSQ